MRTVLLLTICYLVSPCVHKNEKYKDGDTWVVRSTFVMKCRIRPDGSWNTIIIGCRTARGVVVKPGEVISEGDTTYECRALRDGKVEIKKTYQKSRRQESCEGHDIGEEWVSQRNFRKTCTEKGARIIACVTDAGIDIPLNEHLVLSGIEYTCTRFPNGTVTINREGLPTPTNFKSDLKPVEVFGPMWKNFGPIGSLLPAETEGDRRPTINVHAALLTERLVKRDSPKTCASNGQIHQLGETWISENRFTKKCMNDGSVIILNCLIDDKTKIDVNTEVKLGQNVYKCFREQEIVRFRIEPQ
ncbi:unnamed protein product [Cylicocyclus nassatus]|uniref:Abnormal cell migration protein 18-like fibronectin type I domain-containing protein n=1 Tax=Cylicocyclus nassatus TaxID=53992 RepID=A0AA36GJZ2_CYLNA|nr:unnamed protein product [Cylicocyclus nassatus]